MEVDFCHVKDFASPNLDSDSSHTTAYPNNELDSFLDFLPVSNLAGAKWRAIRNIVHPKYAEW